MTRIFQVNENNDIFTTPGGRIAISADLPAVLQQCEQAVKAQTSEMIYANNRGVNTFDSVWSGSPNLLSFEATARDTARPHYRRGRRGGFPGAIKQPRYFLPGHHKNAVRNRNG